MALYVKRSAGVERHSVRAIKTTSGIELISSIWMKSVNGILRVYEAVRACYAAIRWRYEKPWTYKDKWKY